MVTDTDFDNIVIVSMKKLIENIRECRSSGSSVAALGIRAIGIERTRESCDISVQRLRAGREALDQRPEPTPSCTTVAQVEGVM
jgi:hypothetical protein